MDLSLIEMSRAEAREKFLEYRRSVRERHDAEDEQIMRGYRELARGRQLISLSETIKAGGVVEKIDSHYNYAAQQWVKGNVQLPALAVMRADLRECWLETRRNGTVTFLPDRWYRGRRDRISVGRVVGDWAEVTEWRAMVPIVPPALRPSAHLRNFHILWEADWEKARPPRPPGDPALLKRIGGDLFAVLAIWDLTEIERAVLAGRR